MNNFTRFVTCAFAGVFMAGGVSAQSFEFAHDTVMMTVSTGVQELHNDLHNISTGAIAPSWQVVDYNLPASWTNAVGICDNQNCYSNMLGKPGPLKNFANVAAGTTGVFDLQVNATSALTSGGPYWVKLEVKDGTTTEYPVFIFYKWATNVATVNKEEDIVLYPNPATSELNVLLNNNTDVTTAVLVNTLGQSVAVYPLAGKESKLALDKLAPGAYFVKLLDAQNNVKAVRQVMHQ